MRDFADTMDAVSNAISVFTSFVLKMSLLLVLGSTLFFYFGARYHNAASQDLDEETLEAIAEQKAEEIVAEREWQEREEARRREDCENAKRDLAETWNEFVDRQSLDRNQREITRLERLRDEYCGA